MRRFNRSADKRSVIDQLTSSNGGAFAQIWQVMIFAACLGVHLGRKVPLGDLDSGLAIPASVLTNNCPSWPGLLYLVGLVETSDPTILNQDEATDERRMKLIEEYANGGLAYLAETLESRSFSLDSVCQMIAEMSARVPEMVDRGETI